jgi:hypothetical protein
MNLRQKRYSTQGEAPPASETTEDPWKLLTPRQLSNVVDETHPQEYDVDEMLMAGIRAQARSMAKAHVDSHYKRQGGQRRKDEALDFEDAIAKEYEKALIDYYVGKKQRTE